MRRTFPSMTHRLRSNGQRVHVQIAAGIHRRMERQAAAEGVPVQDAIRAYFEPLVPEHRRRRRG